MISFGLHREVILNQRIDGIGGGNTKKISSLLGNSWNHSRNFGAFDTVDSGCLRTGWVIAIRQLKGNCKNRFSYLSKPESVRYQLRLMEFIAGELIPITYSLALGAVGNVLYLNKTRVGSDDAEPNDDISGTLLQESCAEIPEQNKAEGYAFVADLKGC